MVHSKFEQKRKSEDIWGESSGLTLVEIIIVIGIVAVLAIVGIPSLHRRAIRKRISESRLALRSSVVALESYWVDWSEYPLYGNALDVGDDIHFLPYSLTTPINYFSDSILSELPVDVFSAMNAPKGIPEFHGFHYIRYPSEEQLGEIDQSWTGKYIRQSIPLKRILFGHGPDEDTDWARVVYDSTNGLVSSGDIVRP